MSEVVALERPIDHVAVLTLRRPEKRNALSIEVRERLSDHLDDLAADAGCRAVVVTGEGEVFSSGFDLGEFDRAAEDDAFSRSLWASSDRYHQRLLTFPTVLIAAVNGPAVAGGMDLAVCCDLRIAATNARFAHPERTFGPVVYGPLHDLVGGAVARDLCLTGRALDADEALACGLVSAVVAPDELLDEAIAVAERTALAPRELLEDTKRKAMRRAGVDPVTGTLDL